MCNLKITGINDYSTSTSLSANTNHAEHKFISKILVALLVPTGVMIHSH